MRLVKFRRKSNEEMVGLVEGEDDVIRPITLDGKQYRSLSDLLEVNDPISEIEFLVDRSADPIPASSVKLLPPVDQQEIWASGVTYKRSQSARMEESEASADCYDRVYSAERPELFFKALAYQVVGPKQPVRIRQDAKWNVPEPELTLVINSRKQLVGFTIGNDMSSRDIEGENPLYLPQAKVYDGSAAIGPCITLQRAMPKPNDIGIQMRIHRANKIVYQGHTTVANLVRTYEELVGWLTKEHSFPYGAMLMTGTGVVPDSDFTLASGDVIEIAIDGIGVLRNPVA